MLTIHDPIFLRFGFPIDDVDTSEVVAYLNTLKLPETGNMYVASDEKFEDISLIKERGKRFYAGSFEGGYCCGDNVLLNCGEFHDCPEINIAANDATLFLASLSDIKDGKIDSSKFVEVLVKKGEAVLIYPGTLHFSPCKVGEDKFRVAVILSKGTNLDLEEPTTDPCLWKKNKWLIAHEESKQAKLGAYVGITGVNRRGSLAK